MSRLFLCAVVFTFVGCNTADEEEFGTRPPSNPPLRDPNPGDGPLIMLGDGGRQDAAPDAEAADGGDAGPDSGAADDAAMADAALEPDMAPPIECNADSDCELAVRLDRCDPCPVALDRDVARADRCAVDPIPGATLGLYAPADCFEDVCDEEQQLFTCEEEATRAVCVRNACSERFD